MHRHRAFLVVFWSLIVHVTLARSFRSTLQQVFLPNSVINYDHQKSKDDAVERVAIVGAGPGGTSAAYFLRFLAARNESMKTEVTVYESSDHVGGRVQKVIIPDSDKNDGKGPMEVELGASIFVDVNLNINKAARIFNLTIQRDFGGNDDPTQHDRHLDRITIWDGENFVFSSSNGASWVIGWLDKVKIIWRYGLVTMIRVAKSTKSYIEQFAKLYTAQVQSMGPFDTVISFAQSLNYTYLDWNETSAQHFVQDVNISPLFVNEIVAAATRVNYGQNPSRIHPFAGYISLAGGGEDTKSIMGGNQLIYQNFLNHSGAQVELETTVTDVEKIKIDGKSKWMVKSSKNGVDKMENQVTFDKVIVATPLSLSGITTAVNIPPVEYVRLHVTILTTTAPGPRASFFLAENEDEAQLAPRTIFSTFEYRDVKKPKLNSLNYIHYIAPDRWVVKIFSEEEMDDKKLSDIFGQDQVVWVHRKLWNAYPKLRPVDEKGRGFAPFVLDSDGLYYVNAFEQLASTMETETVSAWNVVQLLTNSTWGYRSEASWAEIEE